MFQHHYLKMILEEELLGHLGHNRLEQGVEMRCWDGICVYDIVLNAHFIKKD